MLTAPILPQAFAVMLHLVASPPHESGKIGGTRDRAGNGDSAPGLEALQDSGKGRGQPGSEEPDDIFGVGIAECRTDGRIPVYLPPGNPRRRSSYCSQVLERCPVHGPLPRRSRCLACPLSITCAETLPQKARRRLKAYLARINGLRIRRCRFKWTSKAMPCV